ncbi:MAG: hypothetical protein ACE5DM_06065 [Candidatus Nanoarchaeia archaeon]
MKPLNLTQLIFEIFVAVGYAGGLLPFVYLLSMTWVIPLTIANLAISIIARNRTSKYTVPNVVMSLLSAIPILGWIPRLIGLILAVLSASKLGRRL